MAVTDQLSNYESQFAVICHQIKNLVTVTGEKKGESSVNPDHVMIMVHVFKE